MAYFFLQKSSFCCSSRVKIKIDGFYGEEFIVLQEILVHCLLNNLHIVVTNEEH